MKGFHFDWFINIKFLLNNIMGFFWWGGCAAKKLYIEDDVSLPNLDDNAAVTLFRESSYEFHV